MATTYEAVFTALAAIERGITGVEEAYDRTPEKLVVFPSFINYPATGETIMESANQLRSLYTLVAELHVMRGILPEAEAIVRPFINRFEDAIYADLTLTSTVATVNAIRHRYGSVEHAGEQHMVCRFELDIKIRRAI